MLYNVDLPEPYMLLQLIKIYYKRIIPTIKGFLYVESNWHNCHKKNTEYMYMLFKDRKIEILVYNSF